MSIYKEKEGVDEQGTEPVTLDKFNPIIHAGRVTGEGFHIVAREYPGGDVEMTALHLTADDKLHRGGGAKRENDRREEMSAKSLNESQRRARSMVRRKCMTIQADRLLTLTTRENIQDVDRAWSIFARFTRMMKKRYKDFKYVAVPEYQKRGAVHFHLAIRGYYHANTVRRLWNRAIGEGDGNIDITSPKKAGKNSWNPKRISAYIAKYITKEESTEFNRKRYSSGGKIQLPPPMVGWMPYCDFVVVTLCNTLETITRSPVRHIWESEQGVPIIYIST